MRTGVDVGFADYVRARQGELLRTAYLLCGDARLAEVVLGRVLSRLALRWERMRSEDPDDFVRRSLYREAAGRRRKARAELDGLDPDLFDEDLAEAAGATPGAVEPPDIAKALTRLTPRQRSVLVARLGEKCTEHETAELLGMTALAVARQIEAALERLASLTSDPGLSGAGGSGVPGRQEAVERELGQRLAHGSPRLREVDLGESAWAGAVETVRRRRRSVLGWTASAVAAALLASGLVFDDRPIRKDVVPRPTTVTVDPPYQRTFSDVRYVIAPEVGAEQSMRPLDFPLPRELPRRVGTPSRWDWPDDQPIVAVALLPASGDRYAVVVHGLKGTAVQVPDLLLTPVLGADGTVGLPLGPRSVSPDGQRVALLQPGRVLLFQVATGELRTVELPNARLGRVGWSAGGVAVIVGSDQESWAVDPLTLRARHLPQVAPAGPYSIGGSGVPRPFLQTWSGDGTYVDGMSLPLPPGLEGVGETVDNGLGWAGRAAFLSPDIPSRVNDGLPGQGLVAVQSGLPSSVRLLLFGHGDQRPKGCCLAVGWRGHILLFTSVSKEGTVHLLGWDVGSAEVLTVAEIPSRGIALGPGARSVPRAGAGR